MPAENSTTKKPTVDQTSTAMTHHRARFGSPSQSGWTLPSPIRLQDELMRAAVRVVREPNSRATIAIDSTCGKK